METAPASLPSQEEEDEEEEVEDEEIEETDLDEEEAVEDRWAAGTEGEGSVWGGGHDGGVSLRYCKLNIRSLAKGRYTQASG